MLPHLVLLIEYSTEVLKVFQNFITLKSFSLQIHAKTKYKTSKKLKGWLSFKVQFKIEFLPPGTGFPIDLW